MFVCSQHTNIKKHHIRNAYILSGFHIYSINCTSTISAFLLLICQRRLGHKVRMYPPVKSDRHVTFIRFDVFKTDLILRTFI
jgi:hypothetical protein